MRPWPFGAWRGLARTIKNGLAWSGPVKKCSSPTSNTNAIRVSVGNVGINLPFSSCESMDGESPVCLPKSTSEIFLFSRRRRNFSPTWYEASDRSTASPAELCSREVKAIHPS